MTTTNRHRIRSLLALATIAILTLTTACTEEAEIVPSCGTATYEVTYSKDLRDDQSFGPALPHNLSCVFDSSNLKMTASAPFGLAKLGIYLTKNDSFVTIDFDRAKLLLSLEEFTGNASAIKDSLRNIEIIQSNDLIDISGFMSSHVTIRSKNNGVDTSVDFFFIPFGCGKSCGQTEPLNLNVNSQWPRLPGLMTAMNVKFDDSNIMLVIKDVKPTEGIDRSEFERPRGYIEASRHDLMALSDLMLN